MNAARTICGARTLDTREKYGTDTPKADDVIQEAETVGNTQLFPRKLTLNRIAVITRAQNPMYLSLKQINLFAACALDFTT